MAVAAAEPLATLATLADLAVAELPLPLAAVLVVLEQLAKEATAAEGLVDQQTVAAAAAEQAL
jgi:hypothetical protein